MSEFEAFPKMARLSREIVITEKLDGTNAQILITDDGQFFTGSRNRWITPDDDNYGFSRWAHENKEELMKLGPGRHFGEWWGKGIQRGYGLEGKKFSLFNSGRWYDSLNHVKLCPDICDVVPVLYRGPFDTPSIDYVVNQLANEGSRAAPGFMDPEGIIIFHTASRESFKKTIRNDDIPKGKVNE